MIKPETVKEFQEAILKDYDRNVSIEEARLILTDLIGYFDTLAQIDYEITKEAKVI